MKGVATDFEKIIHTARERKKNEALADKIFSQGRRNGTPSRKPVAPGGSLASRVGVKKPQHQQQPPRGPAAMNRRAGGPAGNVNGDWTHDLHPSVNGKSTSSRSLSARITHPGAASASAASAASRKKSARLAAAVDRMDTDEEVRRQVNIIQKTTAKPNKPAQASQGMSIRGLAGPFVVMGQNFAPGTTAADVESAMTPVGGDMLSCTLVKTQPFLLVEMTFASREGGERVIDTFNNKTADGRVIKIYPKVGGQKPQPSNPSPTPTTNRRAEDQIVDGTMGFPEDLMNTKTATTIPSNGNRLSSNDKSAAPNRRGRGFQRGRLGR